MSEMLEQLSQLRQELAKATTLDEVKRVVDKAEALRVLAKRVGANLETQNRIAEDRLWGERLGGEMLRDGDRQRDGRPKKPAQGAPVLPTLSEIGVERTQAQRWQRLAEIPKVEFTRLIRETLEDQEELTRAILLRWAKEEQRENKRKKNRKLVEQVTPPCMHVAGSQYQTIVTDPPWDWGDEGDVDQFGRGRPTYATMTFEEIAAVPVGDLAEKNAHIYLWITNRSLPKGFLLLEEWGFRYVTALTWCKPSIGMGNYFRGSTEHVLFGVKGSLELLRHDVGTWFQAPRPGRHSAKPSEFFQLVEQCSPGPWLEMFAREPRPGWSYWGAEV